ncbi:hypothetical protein KSP40_PGU013066 [Platanthera guangdongensis]|uniref:Uncharacterized protein n=1 Tax=Platanthera guangdongensis TaxID=2320717 RepID=A0ABR2LSP7_9ASPA
MEKEREAMQFLEIRECEYDKKASVEFYKVITSSFIICLQFTNFFPSPLKPLLAYSTGWR